MLLWWLFEDFFPWRKSFYTYIAANEISIDCCGLHLVVATESFINTYLANYFHLSQFNIGSIYIIYIHLPGRHYNVKHFHPQAFLSEQSHQVCPYFVFSGLFLDGMQLLRLISLGCLYRLEFISFTPAQAVSGLPARFFFCRQVFLGRFESFPRQGFR